MLFPALIFLSLATTDFTEFPALAMGGTLFGATVALALVSLALKRSFTARFGIDGPAFTSLFQGATRWNTFIGLAVAGSLYGSDGLAMISVAIVAIVPLANLMSVLVLAHWAADQAPGAGQVLRAVLRNPFIWACALGMAANMSGLLPPPPLDTALDIMGSAAIAAGLIAVGAGLDLAALGRPKPALLASGVLKLVLMPAVGAILAFGLGLTGTALGVAIIALAVPTATNAYVLAREMGGDAPLMAEIVTFQTVIAMATLPLWIALLAG